MLVQKIALTLASCIAALLLTSCTSNSSVAKSDKAYNISARAKISQNSQNTQSAQPNFGASLVGQAAIYNSSPGKVALSMLICRLDNSCVYSDLVNKSAKELFDIVSETAFEKNITLESLDKRYGLRDILASENIYVSIESNNVTSLPQPSAKPSTTSSAFYSVASAEKSTSASSTSSSRTSMASSTSTVAWETEFQKEILKASNK